MVARAVRSCAVPADFRPRQLQAGVRIVLEVEVADPYNVPSTQVEASITALRPADVNFQAVVRDALLKVSTGLDTSGNVTVANALAGETTTAAFVNIDTSGGTSNAGANSGSTIINYTGAGKVSGTLSGGDHVVVTGAGKTSLSFNNVGTNYITTGSGEAAINLFNQGAATVQAGTGAATIVAGNQRTTIDLTNSSGANVSLGSGGNKVVLGGSTGSTTINTGGGFDQVVLNTAAKSVTLNSNGDFVITTANGGTSVVKNAEIIVNADGSTITRATSAAEAAISRLYEAVLGRSADADGIATWFAAYNQGATLQQIANAFLSSSEAIGRGFGGAAAASADLGPLSAGEVAAAAATAPQSNADFLQNLYHTFFNRSGDAAGLAHWEAVLSSGTSRADVLLSFVASAEGVGATAATTLVATVPASTDFTPHTFNVVPDGTQTVMGGAGYDVVNFTGSRSDFRSSFDGETTTLFNATTGSATILQDAEFIHFSNGGLIINANTVDQAVIARLYDGLLGRDADAVGLQYWWGMHDVGTSLSSIANSLLTSPEFAASHTAMTNTDFVGMLYHNLLGRDGSSSELAVYTGRIDAGATRADIAVQIAQSGESQGHLSDTIHIVHTP